MPALVPLQLAEVRGSPKEAPSVDRADRKKPDSVARRLPFCGGADPDRSAAESVDEMAQLKQIAKAAQSTQADVGFPARAHAATMTGVPRLIQKWARAGVLEEEVVTVSDRGTGQGSVVSPLLANVYLHYAFDLWARAGD